MKIFSPSGRDRISAADPQVSRVYSELGATVVREVAKLKMARKNVVRFDEELRALVVRLPGQSRDDAFLLSAAVVRRNDTSAVSINEWTGPPRPFVHPKGSWGADHRPPCTPGQKMLDDSTIPDDIRPADIQPLGNYAVQITWEDGHNQVAAYDLLETLERMPVPREVDLAAGAAGGGARSEAQAILAAAADAAGGDK